MKGRDRAWLTKATRVGLCLALAGAASFPGYARQAPQPGPASELPEVGRFAGGASTIRLDAVVTDRAGRPVLTLAPGDFEVKVDGAVERLAGLEVRTPPRDRVFALFLDEFHVSPGAATERLRASLLDFLDTQVRPGDRIALTKPLQPLAALQFTTDRRAIREAIAAFEGRKGDLAPRTSFEEQFIGHAPSAVKAARAQLVTVALTELAVRLGELQAERAALVLVSEGFQRGTQGLSRRQGRLPDLQGLVRAAGHFHFSVYALSPAETPESQPETDTLEWLAAETGGLAVVHGARLGGALTELARDLDGYYELRLPAPASDGRFHRVEVASRKAGLQVRARPGYWAPLASEVRAMLAGSASLPPLTGRALRRSPRIDAWVGLRAEEDGSLALVLTWIPVVPSAGPPERVLPSRLAVQARSESGEMLFAGTLDPADAGGPAQPVARFAAPPGRVELDMEVRAPSGDPMEMDVRDVYVPRLSDGPPLALLPPELVRARTQPEYRRIVAEGAAVPTPSRLFSRSDRLVVSTPVWYRGDARVGIGAGVLNRRGQFMRRLEALTPATDGVARFDLPLAWLAPGEYYIEVAATDGQHKAGERLPFRVTR